jgi:hypothetical protein
MGWVLLHVALSHGFRDTCCLFGRSVSVGGKEVVQPAGILCFFAVQMEPCLCDLSKCLPFSCFLCIEGGLDAGGDHDGP